MSLNHEKVLRLLHQNASAVVDSYDEALAVMFAVAWQPSLGDDLPFGTAVFKRDEGQAEIKPEVLLAGLRQVSKLGMHLTGNMGAWLKTLQAGVGTVHQLQEQINVLQERLKQYEGSEAAQAPGRTGHSLDPRGPEGTRSSH
jgi:hypothetical protein